MLKYTDKDMSKGHKSKLNEFLGKFEHHQKKKKVILDYNSKYKINIHGSMLIYLN